MSISIFPIHQLADLNVPSYPSVTGGRQPITLHSLGEFVYALGWIWLLLLSFTGWGRLLAKILHIRKLPASIACMAGVATTIFIGGWLNIFNAIYADVLFGVVAGGLIAYVALRKNRPEDYRWMPFWRNALFPSRLLLVATLLILAVRVAGTVRLSHFYVSDDSAAYLPLPQQMLDTHHFAADPFSERRIMSSLGGSYFLQNIVLSATSLSNIGMADRTLGLILLAGVVLDLGIAFGLLTFQIALLELLVFIVPQDTFNLTFIVLPVSLLLGIVWLISQLFDDSSRNAVRLAFLAGMIGGAAISLKSTYLPLIGILSMFPCLPLITRRKVKVALQVPLITWLGILIVLIFWMAAMKSTSGTYLYPLLGRGVCYSHHDLFKTAAAFPTRRSLVKIFVQGFALLILACIQFLSKPRTKLSILSCFFLISCAVAITVLNYESSGDSIWRYNFPQFFAAIIVFCASTLAATQAHRSARSLRAAAYVGVLSMVAMVCYYDIERSKLEPFYTMTMEAGDLQPLLASLSGRPLANSGLQEEYRKVEAGIPENKVALENVAYAFLLNYQSHSISIMDWPGAAAPSPGWPFARNAAGVRDYLLRNHVEYLIFDYRYALQGDAATCHYFEGDYRFSQWFKEQLWMNVIADRQLSELKSHYKSIYDDGSIATIDLSQPIPGAPADTSTWTIRSNSEEVCSQIATQLLAARPALRGSSKQEQAAGKT